MHDPLAANLAALVVAQAQVTPDAIAIVAVERTITYRALTERVAAIATFLRRRGLAAEEPVGVLMHRSPDMVAALLAILHAGGAYVPLDPDDPAERNTRIRQKSGARLVLTDHDLGAIALPGSGLEFAVVSDLVAPEPLPPAAPGGAQLAYILFTSGSTGEPKGVEIEHRAAVNLVVAARDLLGFGPSDRYLATSTIGFDISVAELFVPLTSGGSLLLRGRKAWLDPRGLAADIRRHGVTVVQVGPSVWSVVLAEAPDFPHVRIVITTAEPVPPALARRLLTLGDQVWNLYGPTETTVWSTAHRVTHDTAGDSPISASIGRPIARTTIHLLDEHGAPVAAGAEGELWIGGLGLARGYRGDPALTRERFVPHAATGERLYRTGDLVARNATGDLIYFGRNDDQMKIRGVRIEPREVETAILSCPGIAQAAATWFDSSADSRSIVAAVIVEAGRSVTPVQLHTWLAARLSPQMIPSRWLFVADLPRTPSGKIDRQAIRHQAVNLRPAAPEAASRPLNATESKLAGIWRRILNVPAIAADDHFFSIGGDSLAAVRMMTEAESRFKVALPFQVVFEAPTLARLAAHIDRICGDTAAAGVPSFFFPLVETGRSRPVFFNAADLKLAAHGVWRIDAPLYAIAHWAQGLGFVEADSVEALAALHLAAVRTVQPGGPYRIAGFSFGGIVALEMAQQLRRAGEAVELLFLLDPMQPYRTEWAPGGYLFDGVGTPLDETWLDWAARHTRSLWREPRKIGRYVGERLRWHARNSPLKQWVMFQLTHLHGRRPSAISRVLVPRNRRPAFWYGSRRLAEAYVAHRYDGPTLAVFSENGTRYAAWKELLGPKTAVTMISADHGAVFDAPIRDIWLEPLARALATRPAAVP
ncbi:MAG: amino acid adenylation domain-containing protein [Opitutaceae bacterium]|nr:amino acid adenylation domain-containing protein [Opitutaceae bacterium]